MRSHGARIAILFFFSVGKLCAATATPALRNDALPNVIVQSDDGRTSYLVDLLQSKGNGVVLLLPLFTRCSSTCPTLLHKLEKSLAVDPDASHIRVLVFSFDSADTPANLSAFRSASGMPADWTLAHADEEATRALLQYLNYPVMSRGAVFIHPSEIFVLDNTLRWRWTLNAVDWTSKDLSRVIERSGSADFISRLEAQPQAIGWIAFALAISSFSLVLAFWSRHIARRERTLHSQGATQETLS